MQDIQINYLFRFADEQISMSGHEQPLVSDHPMELESRSYVRTSQHTTAWTSDARLVALAPFVR